jgi:hypothetical protein
VTATDHASALRAFDADLFLLEQGLRAVARKEDVSPRQAAELAAWAERCGLGCRAVSTGGPAAAQRGLGGAIETQSVFLGRDAAELEAAIGWMRIEETPGHDQRRRARAEAGRLLGYPRCCVAAFAAQPVCDDAACLERWLGSATASALDPWCNFLLPGSPVRHYPCRADCPATHEAASVALRRMAQVVPAVAAALRALLDRPVLVVDRFRFVVLVGAERTDGSIDVTERYTLLDLCAEEAVQASPDLRRFAQLASELPATLPPTGARDARLLRFAPLGADLMAPQAPDAPKGGAP